MLRVCLSESARKMMQKSKCPDSIDFLISFVNLKLAGWEGGLMISVSIDFGQPGEGRFNKSRGLMITSGG